MYHPPNAAVRLHIVGQSLKTISSLRVAGRGSLVRDSPFRYAGTIAIASHLRPPLP